MVVSLDHGAILQTVKSDGNIVVYQSVQLEVNLSYIKIQKMIVQCAWNDSFQMRPRVTIRRSVRPLVGRSVCPSSGPLVGW